MPQWQSEHGCDGPLGAIDSYESYGLAKKGSHHLGHHHEKCGESMSKQQFMDRYALRQFVAAVACLALPLLAAARILLWWEDKSEGKCDEWLLCGVKCHNGSLNMVASDLLIPWISTGVTGWRTKVPMV